MESVAINFLNLPVELGEDEEENESKLEEYFKLIQVENLENAMYKRPEKYRSEYAALLYHHVAVKGNTIKTFALSIGITPETFYRWGREFPELALAKKMAQNAHAIRWEKHLDNAASGKIKGNAAAIIFGLKNKLPDEYKDKREVDHNVAHYVIDTGVNTPIEAESHVVGPVEQIGEKPKDIEVIPVIDTGLDEDLGDLL